MSFSKLYHIEQASFCSWQGCTSFDWFCVCRLFIHIIILSWKAEWAWQDVDNFTKPVVTPLNVLAGDYPVLKDQRTMVSSLSFVGPALLVKGSSISMESNPASCKYLSYGEITVYPTELPWELQNVQLKYKCYSFRRMWIFFQYTKTITIAHDIFNCNYCIGG